MVEHPHLKPISFHECSFFHQNTWKKILQCEAPSGAANKSVWGLEGIFLGGHILGSVCGCTTHLLATPHHGGYGCAVANTLAHLFFLPQFVFGSLRGGGATPNLVNVSSLAIRSYFFEPHDEKSKKQMNRGRGPRQPKTGPKLWPRSETSQGVFGPLRGVEPTKRWGA